LRSPPRSPLATRRPRSSPLAIPPIFPRFDRHHPVLPPLSWKSRGNLYLSHDSERASLEFGRVGAWAKVRPEVGTGVGIKNRKK
jgi:hypothetical protein